MKLTRSHDRGVALLVVVGVLATLSLLIATFAMLMSVESSAVRNQTEYELARQAAHAGLERVLAALKANPGLATSGEFDSICTDHGNRFFCKETVRRDGLKAGYLIHSADSQAGVHANLSGQGWAGIPTAPVGSLSTGMFDINGMGFAADSDCYMHRGVRYTSLEASLYQCLVSVFDTVQPALPSAGQNIEVYIPGFTTTPALRQAAARVLAHAIATYRYGADGAPGIAGIEDHRAEHLFGGYVSSPLFWANYGDTGTSVSGVYWGTVAGYDSGTGVLTVDTTQRNWRDWPAGRWAGYHVYFATGYNKAFERGAPPPYQFPITASTANTITVTGMPSAPNPGDHFCILTTAGTYGEYKIGRSAGGAGDGIPTLTLWPTGTPAGEHYVWPLHYLFYPILPHYNNRLAEGRTIAVGVPAPALDADELYIGPGFVANWLNPSANGFFCVRILDGAGRGQVRRILNNSADAGGRLKVSAAWTVTPPHDSRYRIEYDAQPVSAFVTDTAGNYSPAPVGGSPAWLRVLGAPWATYINAFAGCRVTICFDPTNPASVGQSRMIDSNDGNTLYLSQTWNAGCVPTGGSGAGSALFRIELPRDARFAPDNVQGDDRTYKSVAEVLSVMGAALAQTGRRFKNPALTVTEANAAAAILYSTGYSPGAAKLKDVLTIANNLIGVKQQYVGINDWSNDGIDNNRNGVIDEPAEAGYEDTEAHKAEKLAWELYAGLGLRDWVENADPVSNPEDTRANRVRQSAQIVANIIDFRDADNVPTRLTLDNLREGTGEFTPPVFGYEGVHITEIMATPPVIDKTVFLTGADVGTELYNDGKLPNPPGDVVDTYDNINAPVPPSYAELKDGQAWDWDPATQGWKLAEDAPAGQSFLGTWRFDLNRKNYGFKPGWYAIRIAGSPSTTYTFQTVSPAQSGTVTTGGADANGLGWGYARLSGTNRLMAVRVTPASDPMPGTLEFQLGHTAAGMRFDAIQLLPQFVEITNCGAQDVDLYALDIGGTPLLLPNAKINGTTVRNAAGVGTFPPVYGTYVITLSEEAYAREYGAGAHNGTWGDAAGEDHTVLFLGDPWPTEGGATLQADARIAQFMFGTDAALPDFKVLSDATTVIAATGTNAVDGDPNVQDGVLFPSDPTPGGGATWKHYYYVSREKAISPFSVVWRNWSQDTVCDDAFGVTAVKNLSASQNVMYRNVDGARTNLNRGYDVCWEGGAAAGYPLDPALERRLLTTGATFADGANNRVYPMILNRPYPTPGWLGLVPTGYAPWRTVDSNPTPGTPDKGPDAPEKLLGLFMSRALVGGVHSRINLNNPAPLHTQHALRSILSSADVTALTAARPAGGWGGAYSSVSDWYRRFVGWEELLNSAAVQGIATASPYGTPKAGAAQSASADDPDQREEFVRRYGNLVDLRTANLKYVVAGLVYENGANPATPDAPVAQARIEVEIDLTGTPRVVQFRYLTE